jgi:hypothetical protein
MLGLCVCCLAIAGLKGAVKLSGGPVDAGISELLIEVSESSSESGCLEPFELQSLLIF